MSWNGSIPGSGSVTITIDAVIGSTFNAPISNQGSLAYDADGNGVNEAAGVTDDPNVPGAGNPTTIGVAGAIDIPTLSMVGLLSLLGLLAAAALVLMRGRVFDPAKTLNRGGSSCSRCATLKTAEVREHCASA